MKRIYFFAAICLCLQSVVYAQAVWTIKDPNGSDIILDKDSSFLTIHNSYLIMYTLDKETDKRNILVTTGDTTFWLFNAGFAKELSFTNFVNRYSDELVFGIDGTWYITKGTTESTHIFYDNNDPGSIYEYLNVYEFSAVNIDGNNLAIEAIVKASGDTVILYHNSEFNSTTLYSKKLRIIEANLPRFGSHEGSFFIGSVYNDVSQSWGGVGFYREYSSSLRLLLPLGVKQTYAINKVTLSGTRIVDYQDDGSKKVYQYNSGLDSCIEITQSLFPNYTVLDYQNVKWTSYGHPLEPPLSYYNYFWKGRNQSGSIRYYVPDTFGSDLEITDLRNINIVDFIYSDYSTDSIYYYNYSNLQKGLIRYNIYDGGTKKDATSIAFDTEYKLRGYLDRIYYGRYNPQSGKIEASVKDFLNSGEYSFLESTNGKRIEGPIDFTFLDDKVFVHSRTADGLKLVVFDPDGIVAVNQQTPFNSNLQISPNPSSGIFNINLKDLNIQMNNLNFIICNDNGIVVLSDRITEPEFVVNLTGLPSGRYNFSLLSKKSILSNKALILIHE